MPTCEVLDNLLGYYFVISSYFITMQSVWLGKMCLKISEWAVKPDVSQSVVVDFVVIVW